MWDARGDSARLTSATSRLKFDMQSSLTKPVKVEQKIDGEIRFLAPSFDSQSDPSFLWLFLLNG